MTRAFRSDPLPTGLLDELVDLASRAPSAGKTQGWHVIALEGADTSTFWNITLPEERRETFRWKRLLDAPVLLLPLADPNAYVDRYAEPDKAASGLGDGAEAWPVPYWTVDASMAVMTLLLAAEEHDLGALFFGVFRGEATLREALDIPLHLDLLGVIAIGYPASDETDARADAASGLSAKRPRRAAEEIIHRSRWTPPPAAGGR